MLTNRELEILYRANRLAYKTTSRFIQDVLSGNYTSEQKDFLLSTYESDLGEYLELNEKLEKELGMVCEDDLTE